METIRQVVHVRSDRKIELTLPETVEPGLVEIVIVLQPLPNSEQLPRKSLFGFLPRRIDPMEFQRQIRDEWDR